MSNDRDGVPPSAVGTLLRQARERSGLSLSAAAQQLRIRDGYLRAIEEGNFRALPGATYAVGFLRSYADHLGLDPQEIVRRFREEVEELGRRTQLVFPSVPAEGKIPGGAILMIAIVVALFGYGGWYFLSERDTSIAENSPPTVSEPATSSDTTAAADTGAPAQAPAAIEPAAATTADLDSAVAEAAAAAAHTASSAEAATTSTTAEASSEETAAPATTTIESAEAATTAPAGETVAAAEAAAEDADLVPETPSEMTTTEPAAETAMAVATDAPPTDATASDAVTPTVEDAAEVPPADNAVPPEAERHAASEATEVAVTTDGIPASPTLPSGTEDLPEGQQYGVTNADARVVLIATQEAWVQIKKSSGEEVWTKVLRPGDRFMVPNEAGLLLATGNAGGLQVMVDGRPTGALGPIGVVRRGIMLDPDRLIDGTASP